MSCKCCSKNDDLFGPVRRDDIGGLLGITAREYERLQHAGAELAVTRRKLEETYSERNKCVLVIAHMANDAGWRVTHRPDENEKGWNLVFIDTPAGQISWHFSDAELSGFAPFSVMDTKWDGHSSGEKYRRLLDAVSSWMKP